MSTITTFVSARHETGERHFLSPHFMLRVAGLSIDAMNELQFCATAEWTRNLFALEQQAEEKRERLLEVFHEAVHQHAADQALQRQLLGLKRDIFNRRAPKDVSKAAALLDCFPVADRPLLAQWLGQMNEHALQLKKGRQIFDVEMEHLRARLKSVVQDADFRKGLLLSSPTLEKDIAHYLKSSDNNLNRRLRLAERSLLLYLLRTACKTSPFSTFTSVATGSFGDGLTRDAPEIEYAFGDLRKKSYTHINVAILSRLSGLLMVCDEVNGDLPVQLNTGWDLQEGRLRYMRKKQTATTNDAPQALDTIEESIFYLPLSPTLRRLIEMLNGRREVKLGALVHALADGMKSGEDENVKTLLVHLLHLDLLTVPALHVALSDDDVLGDYRRRLAELNNPQAAAVAAHLQQVEACLDSYADATHDERRVLLESIKQEITACFVLLGGNETDLPRTLLYEDSTLSPARLSISRNAWQKKINDLAEFQALLPIFDMTVGSRLVMNSFYKIIYGVGQRCDDVLSFAEVFSQDYYREYQRAIMRKAPVDQDGKLTRSLNHFKSTDIDQLDETRQAFADYIGQLFNQNSSPGSREIVISREAVCDMARRIPRSVRRLNSNSFFSQLAHTGGRALLVINRVYSGLTQMFSRFINPLAEHGVRHLGAGLKATLEEIQPEEAVFAEFQGAYVTNLNLHPGITRYELLFPGEQSSRPINEQIPLSDLYIEHDAAEDRLRLYSKRLRKEVIPLYIGFLLPTALPHLRQVLVNFSHTSFAMPNVWSGVEGLPEIGDRLAFYPRVRFGELILQRAMWRIAPDFFPARAPSQSDAEYFLSVARWRRENGLPRMVFVAPDFGGSRPAPPKQEPEAGNQHEKKTGQEVKADAGAERLITKPMYVDFENFFTVLLLERAVSKGSGRVVMTEMLPEPDQLWFRHDEKPYVTEFVIEMSRAGEDHRE